MVEDVWRTAAVQIMQRSNDMVGSLERESAKEAVWRFSILPPLRN
jgi:hypothetical protein